MRFGIPAGSVGGEAGGLLEEGSIDETEEEKASRIAEEEAARRVSHAIDEAIRQEKQQRKKQKLVRLLLLGQSESGPFRLSRRLPVPYINL